MRWFYAQFGSKLKKKTDSEWDHQVRNGIIQGEKRFFVGTMGRTMRLATVGAAAALLDTAAGVYVCLSMCTSASWSPTLSPMCLSLSHSRTQTYTYTHSLTLARSVS
jgi:hypothetical protein